MDTKASAREKYGEVLVDLGYENPRIVVLGGDLNKSTAVWNFAQTFPERFFDFGPAEQNIMSIAAGFASAGLIPFVSTFSVFATGRPYDQIRVGIAQPGLNVKIVTTHGGIITGEDGVSAQGIEDLALMGALPGFTVIIPADAPETEAAVRAISIHEGPCYIRLGRPATPVVHQGSFEFTIGKAELIRPGNSATIIACGIMVSQALIAAETLQEQGISTKILNMHTIAPPDVEAIVVAAQETGAVVTAEEHLRHGGLGSVIAQVLGERCPVPLRLVSLEGYAESGKESELLQKYGLTSDNIVGAVRDVVARKRL